MKNMKTTPKRVKLKGPRAWIVPVLLAVLASTWALPVKAETITFNPTGGGTGAGAVSGISGFTYGSSSVLAFGLPTPSVGATFPIYYESVLFGTQGTGVNVSSTHEINGSGNEFTVIAGFSERITNISPGPGGSQTLTFAPVTSAPSFFQMFANAPGSANSSTGDGSGFASGKLVLAGTLSPTSFNGAFTTVGQTGAFNNSGLNTTNPTPNTVIGGGGTALTFNVTFQDAGYFPTAIAALPFTTTNTLAFDAVAPLTGFYSKTGITSPDLVQGVNFNTGTVNAVNGQSLMFQTVANNAFLVPEPSSIVPALTSAMALPSFLVFRRWLRGKKRGA